MGPEYPDDFDESKQAASLADAGSAPGNFPSGFFPTGDAAVQDSGAFVPVVPVDAGGGVVPQPIIDAGGARPDASKPVAVHDASVEASVTPDAAVVEPTPGGTLASCSITASTDASDTLFYAGKYGCAVWIGNASSKLVKTFFLATKVSGRSGVSTFQRAASGMTVDAVAGATLNSAKQHQYAWDLKDAKGAAVPPGKYTLNVETHSSNGDTTVSVPFDTSTGTVSAMGSPSGGIRSAQISCQ
jgi:hypothetical protein